MTTVLAIDQGTTATKAVVVGSSGRVLAYASEKVATETLPGGGMQQDPEEIYHAVLTAGAKALAQAGRPIDAVALATQGESVLAFDPATAAPLTPVVTWQDRRAEGICRRLAEHADHLAEATGLRLSSYFTAPKLAWLRENVTREGRVCTVDAWLLYRLTGQFVTDAATASRSLMVDLASGDWDPHLAGIFGLEHEPMPRIVANDAIIGETSVFGTAVPVAGVILDQPAALLAQRCLHPGQMKVTYGTGAFLLANLGPTPPAQPGRLTCSTAWQLGGKRTFCLDGQVFAAASALSWLVRIGVLDRVDQLDTACARTPGRTLLVPGFDEAGGARMSGLDLATGRDQIVAAAVYGIAASVAELYDQAGMHAGVLLVDGGLTQSKALVQAQANLLQIPVRPYAGAHATAQGAAALARHALAPETETDPSAGRVGKPVLPKWDPDQAASYRERWRQIAAHQASAAEPVPA